MRKRCVFVCVCMRIMCVYVCMRFIVYLFILSFLFTFVYHTLTSSSFKKVKVTGMISLSA